MYIYNLKALCAMSVRYCCEPEENFILSHIFVAFPAANCKFSANATLVNTRPPFVIYLPSALIAVPL